MAERAGVTRQWVTTSVTKAVVVGTRHPDHQRLATTQQTGLEIPGAFDLLPDAAEAVRFLKTRADAARPLRDRLIELVAHHDVDTWALVHLTWLERAMVDRIQTSGGEA